MKYFLLIILFILSSCSFDNKSGIWTESHSVKKPEDKFKEFKNLYIIEKVFNKTVEPKNNLKILLSPIKNNIIWHEKNYSNSNNFDNFNYKDENDLFLKSKKLSRYKIKDEILFNDNNLIMTDLNGNVIVYSIEQKKIILKYNFYKKKYKNINKNLNIIFQNNVVYVSDNLGYLYALNISKGNLIWAKNLKIPMRSNIKLINNSLVFADTNNDIYFVNKINGERIKKIPTEESVLKNEFVNTFAWNSKSVFYLNTNGSLYSLNRDGNVRWFLSLNQSSDLKDNSLFYSNTLLLHRNKIIVSTDPYLYIFNSSNGVQEQKLVIPSKIKPVVSENNLFLITKNNLLVCLDINSGNIVYSIDIGQKIADNLKSKKKEIYIKSQVILNNKLFIFSQNSYVIKFSSSGKFSDIIKLPSKLNSLPIFVDGQMIFTNNKNKIVILN